MNELKTFIIKEMISLRSPLALWISSLAIASAVTSCSTTPTNHVTESISSFVKNSDIRISPTNEIFYKGKLVGQDCSNKIKNTISLKQLPNGATEFSVAVLPSNIFWCAGGMVDSTDPTPTVASKETYFYHADNHEITRGPDLLVGRTGASLLKLSDDRIVVIGGNRGGNLAYERSVEVFTPSAKLIRSGGTLKIGRSAPSLLQLDQSSILVLGGACFCPDSVETDLIEVIDCDTKLSTTIGHLLKRRQGACVYKINDQEILVYGGWNSDSEQDSKHVPAEEITLPIDHH